MRPGEILQVVNACAGLGLEPVRYVAGALTECGPSDAQRLRCQRCGELFDPLRDWPIRNHFERTHGMTSTEAMHGYLGGDSGAERLDGLLIAERRPWTKPTPRPRRHAPAAKLTPGKVRRIRDAVAAGASQAATARQFGVSPMQVSRIVRGIQWASET